MKTQAVLLQSCLAGVFALGGACVGSVHPTDTQVTVYWITCQLLVHFGTTHSSFNRVDKVMVFWVCIVTFSWPTGKGKDRPVIDITTPPQNTAGIYTKGVPETRSPEMGVDRVTRIIGHQLNQIFRYATRQNDDKKKGTKLTLKKTPAESATSESSRGVQSRRDSTLSVEHSSA